MAKKKKKKTSSASYTPAYVPVVAPTAPAEYQLGTYNSQYTNQIADAMNTVVNWKYDPMNDANYQALAKIYGARGNIAAKDTLADAAALNGGYGTSYAVSAAQQARNQYNQELAALIPDLEQNAYQKATTNLQVYRDADDTDYNRFRDTEGDRQWQYTQNYNRYQDALSQYQWGLDYNNNLWAQKQAQKKSSGGGGGGRGRSGGGGGGYAGGSVGSGYTSGGNTDPYSAAKQSVITAPGTQNKAFGVNKLETYKEKNKKSGGRVVK